MGHRLLLQTITAAICGLSLAAHPTTAPRPCLSALAAIPQRSSGAPDRPGTGISVNGRFVAFASSARLVPTDRDSQADIYVLDRETTAVTLESVVSDAAPRGGDRQHPCISGDGRFIVFEAAQRSPGGIDLHVHMQIMLRDRRNGTTRMLSVGPDGTPGNATSSNPVISADGRVVAFESAATNLVAGDDPNGGAYDIYVMALDTAAIARVSLDDRSRPSPLGFSVSPTISADGRYVAFTSSAMLDGSLPTPDRSPNPKPGLPSTQVFVRDLQRGVTERASAAANGRPPNGASYLPAISGDGRWVAFVSNATDLAAGDRNDVSDVYLRDLVTSTTRLVSGGGGRAGDGGSTRPALSQNGRFVAFQSDASDLVCRARCPRADEDVNLVSDVFVFDRDSGLIRRVSQDPDGGWLESSVRPAIDPSGRVVVFSSRHPTDEHDLGNDSDLFVWTACAGDSGR